jgi:hypothetical protein
MINMTSLTKMAVRRVLILFATSPFICSGCISNTTQVIKLGGYEQGSAYETRVTMAIVNTDDGSLTKRSALTTIGKRLSHDASMLYGVSEEDVSKYCGTSPTCSKNKEDILETLPAGATITVSRITSRKGWSLYYGSFDDDTRVFGSINPAPRSGANMIDITDLSVARAEGDKIYYAPDPLLLKQIN